MATQLPVVADDDDGVARVEADVREFRLLLARHHLLADRLVLVRVQVEYVHLAVSRHGGEHCR